MLELKWVWENLKGYRKRYILCLTISLFIQLIILVNPQYARRLVDEVLIGGNSSLLVPIVLTMCCVTLGRTIIGYGMIALAEFSAQGLVFNLRVRMYDNLQRQDMHFYGANATGDLMTAMTSDIDMVRHGAIFVFRQLVSGAVVYVSASAYFLSVNWKFALCVLALTPCIFAFTYIYKKKVRTIYIELRQRLSLLNTDAQENIEGNRVVKAFANERHEIAKFNEKSDAFREQNLFAQRTWLRFFPFIEGFAQSMTVTTLLFGGIFMIRGDLSAGEYLAVSSLSWAVSDPFRQLGQLLNDLQHFFASAMKLMNILGARPRVTSPERPERTERAGSGADAAGAPTGAEAGIAGGSVAAGADASDATAVATEIRGRATTETEAEPATAAADIANAAGTPAEAESAAATANAGGAPAITDAAAAETGAESAAADIAAAAAAAETGGASARAVAAGGEIEFRDVSFGFAGTPVLNGVSFHIRPGETYALMGETGSGKTVIADLISRFYDVQSGAVIVDGTDVRKWDLQALRGMIGMTTQETFLFSDTVDGNIAYGNPSLPESEVRKYAAASAAQFIEKLSEGYETIIGERGVGLSGGQKQRIALARALAIHPGILILDDTTSAVDMETEKYIQEQLEALDFPCTKLVIAQRISSVKNADCILLLHGGAIAERGTHAELIAKNGRYRDLWKIQTGVAELAGDIADLASGAAELAGDMADPGGCGAELTGAANPTDPATPANPARTANPVSSADPAPTADPMNPPSSANPARPADPASPAVPARPAKGGG